MNFFFYSVNNDSLETQTYGFYIVNKALLLFCPQSQSHHLLMILMISHGHRFFFCCFFLLSSPPFTSSLVYDLSFVFFDIFNRPWIFTKFSLVRYKAKLLSQFSKWAKCFENQHLEPYLARILVTVNLLQFLMSFYMFYFIVLHITKIIIKHAD